MAAVEPVLVLRYLGYELVACLDVVFVFRFFGCVALARMVSSFNM